MPIKPALRRFQHELDVLRIRDDRICIERIQGMNFLDYAVRIDICRGEWERAVLHPERGLMRHRKDEEHALVLRHIRAEHHARFHLDSG